MNSRSYEALRLLWFSAGFALATVLSIGVTVGVNPNPMRFIPVSVAFGLLCVGTGVVFTELVALWRQENEGLELIAEWREKIKEVNGMKAKLEEDEKLVEEKWKEAKEAEDLWCQQQANNMEPPTTG